MKDKYWKEEAVNIIENFEKFYFTGDPKEGVKKKPFLVNHDKYLDLKKDLINREIGVSEYLEKLDDIYLNTPKSTVSSPEMKGSLEGLELKDNHFKL